MNIFEYAKLKLGFDKKLLEKPIEKMDIVEIEKNIILLIQKMEKENLLSNRIYELIDTFDVNYRETLTRQIISFVMPQKRIPFSLKNELINNLLKKYYSREEKIQILLKDSVYFGFELDKTELYYSMENSLNDLEKIVLFEYIPHNNEETKKFFSSLSIKSKRKFLEKNNVYFNKLLDNLPEHELIFFRNENNMFNIKKIDVDMMVHVLETDEPISEIVLKKYFRYYNKEEREKLIYLFENANISDERKGKIITLINETKQIKQKSNSLAKYIEIKNEEEKTKYFNNFTDEVINANWIIFEKEFEKISKEELLIRFGLFDNGCYILRHKYNSKELYELLKNGKIKNLNIEEEDILNLTENEIEEILNLNLKHDYEYVHSIVDFIIDNKDNKELQPKVDYLKIIAIKYLLKGEKYEKIWINQLLNGYQDIINVCGIIPEVLKYINFDKLTYEELIKLDKVAYNNLEYNLSVLKLTQDSNIKIQKILSILSNNISELNENDTYDIKEIFHSLNEEEIKEIYTLLESVELKKMFISMKNVAGKQSVEKNALFFLELIDDENRTYTKMYESMRNSSGYIESKDHLKFFENIDVISKNKEKLLELQKYNPNLFKTINYDILDIFEDSRDVSFFSRYNNLQVIDIEKNREIYKRIVSRLYKTMNSPEELIQHCFNNIKLEDEIKLKFQKEEDIDKLIFMVVKKSYLMKSEYNIYELIRDFEEAEEKYLEKELANSDISLEKCLDIYMRKFFNMTYEEALDFVNIYGSGVENLLKRYKIKEHLTVDEQMEVSSLNRLIYIRALLNVKNVSVLKECYEKFSNDPEFANKDYLENLICEENIRRAYTKEKKENLYVPKDSEKIQEIEYKGSVIDIYKPQKEWNMLVSVIGAYVKNDRMKENPKEEWNNKNKLQNHGICTSLIGNNNLGMAERKNNLIFGFYNIGDNSIYKEAEYDLWSDSNDITITTEKLPVFRTTKDMINHVRLGYNETVLERRDEKVKNDLEKRQPDYIIAINTINECDKKAAKEFDIPIVFLDTREIALRESEKIKLLKEKFKKEPESETLHTIIEEYHNNYVGLIEVDKKSCKKYFNPRKMEKDLLGLVDDIAKLNDDNKRNELLKGFEQFLEEEEKKRMNVYSKNIPFLFKKLKKKINENIPQNLVETEEKTTKINSKRNIYGATSRTTIPISKKDKTMEKIIDEINER